MSDDLDREVRTLLEAKRGEWPRVCKSAVVSHSWLSKFMRGKIPNPGYATLKRIHGVLATPGAQPEPEPEKAKAA